MIYLKIICEKNITALTIRKIRKIRFDENFIELTLHYLFCATSPIRAISGVG